MKQPKTLSNMLCGVFSVRNGKIPGSAQPKGGTDVKMTCAFDLPILHTAF